MTDSDLPLMRLALQLARRGWGRTSPNPMVGAVIVKGGRVIGRGWHRQAGRPHAEVEALRDAKKQGHRTKGSTLYVTLEPCSTHGRTPPCTEAIIKAGLKRVVVAARDPNPRHGGRGLRLLRRAGLEVDQGPLREESERLNEAFSYWIVHGRPWVTVKAAMTLDGKTATASGESKWITGLPARRLAMKERRGSDAILVGVNTVLADDPALTVRPLPRTGCLRRLVLDTQARTPLASQVVSDCWVERTTIVVGQSAPKKRVKALSDRVTVWEAPLVDGQIDLNWLLGRLGEERVCRLLVEGGGEVNASFLLKHLAHRVIFFYAPKVLGGATAKRSVGGKGVRNLEEALRIRSPQWRRVGVDLMLTGLVS